MLQKSIWDVAYVTMTIYACFKHMFSSVSVVSKVCFKCFIMMLQKYIWMLHNMHVFKCFRCYIRMLQVFYLDVAKQDLDVAYVVMAIHVCFKAYVSSVSSVFSRMLQSVSTRCFKSRYGGAYVVMALVAGGQRLAIDACYCCWGAIRGSPCRCLRPVNASRRIRGWGEAFRLNKRNTKDLA
jgi:hypothetical protein